MGPRPLRGRGQPASPASRDDPSCGSFQRAALGAVPGAALAERKGLWGGARGSATSRRGGVGSLLRLGLRPRGSPAPSADTPTPPPPRPPTALQKRGSRGKTPARAPPGSLMRTLCRQASAAAVATATATLAPRQLGSEGSVDPRGTPVSPRPVTPPTGPHTASEDAAAADSPLAPSPASGRPVPHRPHRPTPCPCSTTAWAPRPPSAPTGTSRPSLPGRAHTPRSASPLSESLE